MATRGKAAGNRREPFERLIWRGWGRTLRAARQGEGLTQTALAAELGVDQAAVSRWESGDSPPNDRTKVELSRFFDRPLGELFPWPAFTPPAARHHDGEAAA